MSMDRVIDLGKACDKDLSEAEAARLREIGERLDLREDDALWPLLAALEYQRIYYKALPKKIADASLEIMDGMAAAAKKETAAVQPPREQRPEFTGRALDEWAQRYGVRLEYSRPGKPTRITVSWKVSTAGCGMNV